MTWFLGKDLNPKKVGERGQAETTCGFSKNVFSRERVKPCCFVTFDNSPFSWKFDWNSSSRSQDVRIFFFDINYFIV